MATDDENTGAGMGTTGTPNTSGAAAIDDPDQPNGAGVTSAGGASAGGASTGGASAGVTSGGGGSAGGGSAGGGSAGGASAGATGVRGTGTPRTGGAVDDPDLPFDRPPSDDDPVHRAPRYGQR